MRNKLTLYHGSANIIEKPEFGKGNPHNDFGLGFYCTESEDIAKEWACATGSDGYSNSYAIDTSNLRVMNIEKLSTIEWLSVLLRNRTVAVHDDVSRDSAEYIRENFPVDVTGYDIITGYRADDRYFTFVRRFLDNTIGYRKLSMAMNLGKLGLQTAIITERAFERLRFTGAEPAYSSIWSQAYNERMVTAATKFEALMSDRKSRTSDIYMINIIQEGMKLGDPRLQ